MCTQMLGILGQSDQKPGATITKINRRKQEVTVLFLGEAYAIYCYLLVARPTFSHNDR